MNDYDIFIAAKRRVCKPVGFDPIQSPIDRHLFPFQADIVKWAVRRGRAALFEDCGLGKTRQQLAWADQVEMHTGKPVMILAPLAVAEQTVREGEAIGCGVNYVSDDSEVSGGGIFITNYQKLHRFDPKKFAGVALDESSILKSFDGATKKALIDAWDHTPFRLACTATPAPNDLMEIGNHAEFLGIMSREEMLSMYFVHDGGETQKWRLKGHAKDAFWRWICSWAVNIRKPSDIGHSDDAFVLPPLRLHEHIVESNQQMDGYLLKLPASSMDERRDARKCSLADRVKQAADLCNADGEQWLVWCNLNTESVALTKQIHGAVEITGSDSDESKCEAMKRFIDGTYRVLVSKPSIVGFGMNLQHCSRQAFVGLSDSYEQFYQAVRRCWRFGQKKPVDAHIVISDLEGAVLSNIKRKEADAQRMALEMTRFMSAFSKSEITGKARNERQAYAPKMVTKLPSWAKK